MKMKEKTMVYISSHYTRGNGMKNIRKQMDIANSLKKMGHYPLIPLLLPFFELAFPEYSEDELLEWELIWLAKCEALVRIRFEDELGFEIPSRGADIEVKKAEELGIPVFEFSSIEEMELSLNEYILI